MSAPDWAGLLGYWSHGTAPMYKLLAEALQKAVLEGSLASGTRLPAERDLAQLLAVSRTTVAGAYNLLRRDDWVESRTGSGTWVRPVLGARSRQRGDAVADRLKRNPMYDAMLGRDSPLIDLSKAGGGDPKSLPAISFLLSQCEIAQLLEEPGYLPLGLPALRQAIAARYSQRGLPTTEDQILVTNGAQQAISLAVALYAQRGDSVLIENPTFVGTIDAFRAAGSRLVPLQIEGTRLRVDLLPGLVRANFPQLIYVTPTCQNPTGIILSDGERSEIIRVAVEHGIPVLEDDTMSDLILGGSGQRPHLLATYSDDTPVITVGSMSKLFWAGLRVGWVRAPQPVIARMARLKLVADLGTSLIPQAIAVHLLEQAGSVSLHRREELLPALAIMSSMLQERLPSWTWAPPLGGTFLWVKLPCVDAREYAQMALRYGTIVVPGTTVSVDGSHTDYLRLPFLLGNNILQEGVARLADAWAAFTGLAGRERHMMSVVV